MSLRRGLTSPLWRVVGMLVCSSAAATAAAATGAPGVVRVYPLGPGQTHSLIFELSVNGQPVPVVDFHNNERVEYRYAQFQHYQNDGVMEDIHFVNINVEELAFKGWKPSPFRLEIRRQGGVRAGARVRNVEITNVNFQKFGDGEAPDGYNGQNSFIEGQSATSTIENVAFTDLRIAGRLILDAAAGHIDIKDHAKNITFAKSR